MAEQYGVAVSHMGAARHIVLTAPSMDGCLREQIDQMRASMRRLRQQSRWKRRVLGGVYSIEVTRNAKTGLWHPHIHIIADGDYYEHRDLMEDWSAALRSSQIWGEAALGKGAIVYISAVHNRHQLARYIAKYIAKPERLDQWPHECIAEYAIAVRGLRMMHTFGSLHGVKLSGDEPNAVPEGRSVVCGLSEIDWRAHQGYPAAQAAVALLRASVPVCALWLGAPRNAPLDAWASAVEDKAGELVYQVAAMRRQAANGPPHDGLSVRERERRANIEKSSKAQGRLID